jgi:hypothetical protein
MTFHLRENRGPEQHRFSCRRVSAADRRVSANLIGSDRQF